MTKLTEGIVLSKTSGSDLANIKKLNCWGTSLTDVSVLRKMPNVQVVTFSVNKISTLEDFSYCPNLEELYVRKNSITKLSEILYLQKCPRLRFLWLADNPCAIGDRYRMTVLKALPQLQKLDNIDVEDDELAEAAKQGQDLSHEDLNWNAHGDENRSPKPGTNCIMKNGSLTISSEPANSGSQQICEKNDSMSNNNVLQAALCLVKELDTASLEILQEHISERKNYLQEFLQKS